MAAVEKSFWDRVSAGTQPQQHDLRKKWEGAAYHGGWATLHGVGTLAGAWAADTALSGGHGLSALVGLGIYAYLDRNSIKNLLKAPLQKLPQLVRMLPKKGQEWLRGEVAPLSWKSTAIAAGIGMVGWAGIEAAAVAMGFGPGKALALWQEVNADRMELIFGPGFDLQRVTELQAYLNDKTTTKTYSHYFEHVPFVAGAAGVLAAWRSVKRTVKGALAREAEMKPKHRRGVQLITRDELKVQIQTVDTGKRWKGESMVELFDDIKVPRGTLQFGWWIVGGPGSGKTMAFKKFMVEIFKMKGITPFIFGNTGEFVEEFFRPGRDILFDPFDDRFCATELDADGKLILKGGWCLMNELRTEADFDKLMAWAAPIKDERNEQSAYFTLLGRKIGSCILRDLRKEGRTSHEDLLEALNLSQDQYVKWLSDPRVKAILDTSKGDSAGGQAILATILNKLDVLRYVRGGDFSIKDFVQKHEDRRFFLEAPSEFSEQLKPLVGLVTNIYVESILALPPSEIVHRIRFPMFMDEFITGGEGVAGPMLRFSALSRKYGGSLFGGLQNQKQLETIMMEHQSTSLRSNVMNKMIFRTGDFGTAEMCSKDLGQEELDDRGTNMGYSGNGRDNDGENYQRKDVFPVYPTDIMMLPILKFYFRPANGYDIALLDAEPVIVRGSRQVVQGKDKNGNPLWMTDADGNVMYDLDSNGDPKLDEDGDPVRLPLYVDKLDPTLAVAQKEEPFILRADLKLEELQEREHQGKEQAEAEAAEKHSSLVAKRLEMAGVPARKSEVVASAADDDNASQAAAIRDQQDPDDTGASDAPTVEEPERKKFRKVGRGA